MKPKLSGRRGVSLIVVLGCVVFLSALILAFLSGAKTELRSSKLYADGSSVRLLAQSAVNIVMAEIGEATKTKGGTQTWASQPGMIRTYDNSGQKQWYYKLYSDTVMTGRGDFNPTDSGNRINNTWFNRPAVYTDLNEPVAVRDVLHYPVVDGNVTDVNGNGTKTYADSDNKSAAAVEGFFIASDAPVASGAAANPVPLPVKWLYVLADGKVVAPADTEVTNSGTTVRIRGASKGNPIVGRMAFWTDDETCKINVNTASEGTYWDTPRVMSYEDFDLAWRQPAKGEFQRYPGHPAMVSLSTVFKKTPDYTDNKWREEVLYDLAPHIGTGGSQGGTLEITGSITLDEERLYVSVDELLFKPTVSGGVREERAASQKIDKQTLVRDRFFLTANSRSPDVNLFGKPRVSIWPITLVDGAEVKTAYDEVLAFCASIRKDSGSGRNVYYFRRQENNSPTTDLPTADSDTGLQRNRRLLKYLRNLASKDIPGFGGSFAAKYNTPNGSGQGTDCDQILTEIFDYIRSTNLFESSHLAQDALNNPTPAQQRVRYTKPLSGSSTRSEGVGQVMPIHDTVTETRGFGRFPTVQSVSLVLAARDDDATTKDLPSSDPNKVPDGEIRLSAMCLVQFFNPSVGPVNTVPIFHWELEGLDNFSLDGKNMGFVKTYDGQSRVHTADGNANGSGASFYGGVMDFFHFYSYNWDDKKPKPYVLNIGNFPKTNSSGTPITKFPFSGGDVTVKIYALSRSWNRGELVQTVKVHFEPTDMPVPRLIMPPGGVNFRKLEYRMRGDILQKYPMTGKVDTVRSVVVDDARLAAAYFTVDNNVKLASGRSVFDLHPFYSSTSPYAHNLRNGKCLPYYGASAGKLANVTGDYPHNTWLTNGIQLSNDFGSDTAGNAAKWGEWNMSFSVDAIAVSSSGAFTANGVPGDWDTGMANINDGPYINKPDEGDIPPSSIAGNPQNPYFNLYGDNSTVIGPSFFSPNRIISSPVMFGSLPSEVFAGHPWQTLLFRPGPTGHRGLDSPKDWLLLDLFHMPVVEPYPISEPLSTAGRINMNYQIVPFAYIHRDTALRAVLKAERITVIPRGKIDKYKSAGQNISNRNSLTLGGFINVQYRWPIDIDATLAQFEQRFTSDLFRSSAEICGIWLIPADPENHSDMNNYWNTHGALTGDNVRERPYANIYPHLTTKSNVFTVHMRVQTLKPSPNDAADEWNEARGAITGEFRGSQTIERYVDPNDTTISDFADRNNYDRTLDSDKDGKNHYKFRVVGARQFAP